MKFQKQPREKWYFKTLQSIFKVTGRKIFWILSLHSSVPAPASVYFTFFWRPLSEIPKFTPTSFIWDTHTLVCLVTPLLSIKQTCQIKRRYVCVGEPKPIRPCRSYASLFLFGDDVDWFLVQGRNWDVCIANIQSSTLSIVNPARVRNSQWARYQRMEMWAGNQKTTRPGNKSELICIQSQSRNNEPVLSDVWKRWVYHSDKI